MIKAKIKYKEFQFRRPATTSRETFFKKQVYFLLLYNEASPSNYGIGECSLFPGLSMDDVPGFKKKLFEIVQLINKGWFNLNTPIHNWPSINFAIETALKDLAGNGDKILYPSDYTAGKDSILINGLIWMDEKVEMKKQIEQKINSGFHCLKLKIGNLDIEEELELIRYIRNQFSVRDIELRVDANGAYSPDEVPEILKKLADFNIHSIEQPILPSQLEEMASLCESTPLPIALDEELIGKYSVDNKRKLLSIIRPQYIVIKPGLLGGIKSGAEWVEVAKEMNIGWWITSSLESNIGLNVISQWTYTLKNPIPHGLSTGALFENNIDSPLSNTGDHLNYAPNKKWNLSFFSSNNTTDYED